MTDEDSKDIRLSLARAFDRAWTRYYQAGRLTVCKDVARTELARLLVVLSKQGVRNETSLAAAGVKHLLLLQGGGASETSKVRSLLDPTNKRLESEPP
jgi:hypothetical protein